METSLDRAARDFAHGRFAEALRLALLASGESPRQAQAPALAAAASHALGRPEDGMRWFRQARALDPDDPELACGLAACLFDLKLVKTARTTLEEVLREHPLHIRAWCNLALACEADGDPSAALAALERAAILAPADTSVLRARIALALRSDLSSQAMRLAQSVVAGQGNDAETLHLLLESALKSARPDTAMAAATELLALSQGDTYARRGLACAFALRGEFDLARREAQQLPDKLRADFDARQVLLASGAAALRACDWSGLATWLTTATQLARDPAARLDATEIPFHALAAGLEAGLCGALFNAYANDIASRHVPVKWPRPQREPRTRVRIGYIGAGFGEHPSAMQVNPIMVAHERQRFEVYAYALTPDDRSSWRAASVQSADVFRDVAQMSAQECAGLLMTDDIDVLVDLSGLLDEARPGVHLHRPARTHLLLFGTPATLSIPGVDAMIGDAVVLAADEPGLRMPGCYLPIDPRWAAWAREGAAPTRRDHGLPADAPVLCCFNTAHKIEPRMFDAWARILKQCPESVLWLLAPNAATRENLRAHANHAGIDQARLIFADRMPLKEHLKRLRLADVFVDTLYYGAHVTAMQALAAGLPLLTMRGDRFAARVGASALIHAGLGDLVAADLEDYVLRALQFCQRSAIAADWRGRTQAAFAAEVAVPRFAAYVQALESLYLQAFQQASRRT